jgi:hypothetical protein
MIRNGNRPKQQGQKDQTMKITAKLKLNWGRVTAKAVAAGLQIALLGACTIPPPSMGSTTQEDRSDPFCRIAICDGTSSAGDETCEAACGLIWTCSHLVVSIDANGVITRQQWYCTDELPR